MKGYIDEITLVKKQSNFPKTKIIDSKSAYAVIRKFYNSDIDIYESMFLLLVNRNNITTGFVKISQGGTAGTVVDVKIIMKYVIETLSNGFILAHNHPSGNLNPSHQDDVMTKRINEAAKLLECSLLDHLIVTDKGYFSYKDEGKF